MEVVFYMKIDVRDALDGSHDSVLLYRGYQLIFHVHEIRIQEMFQAFFEGAGDYTRHFVPVVQDEV